ncbi:DEAD/DEAH box helicase family protein [Nocardia sp. NPDC127606]|uniref:DEAD/DEAH box helicase family protein n=1 Tax=Nocardia sp. NPDC127606 TaxID=3345406 RepID=UPI00363893A4
MTSEHNRSSCWGCQWFGVLCLASAKLSSDHEFPHGQHMKPLRMNRSHEGTHGLAQDSEALDRLKALPVQQDLRPYQAQLIAQVEHAIASGTRTLTVYMPPGTGKTITAFRLIDRLGESGVAKQVLYLARTRAMALQAVDVARQLAERASGNYMSRCQIFSGVEGLSSTVSIQDRISELLCVSSLFELKRSIAGDQSGESHDLESRTPNSTTKFDLVIVDEWSGDDFAGFDRVANFLNNMADAIIVRFTTSPVASTKNLEFEYTFDQALADGVVVDHRSIPSLPSFRWGWKTPANGGRTFIVCADEDQPEASRLHTELLNSGFNARTYFADTVSADDPLAEVQFEMRKGDIVIYCLSPNSVDDPRLQIDLDRLFARRGTTLLFAIIKPCAIPQTLSGHAVVDATESLHGVINSLNWVDIIDLPGLLQTEFSNLVGELLPRIGFSLKQPEYFDTGIDFRGIYHDHLGLSDPTEYVIQVKYGQSDRLSVRDLWMAADSARNTAAHILIVTNFQLTSLAMTSLVDANNRHANLRVFDSLRIKNLLLNEPDLVAKYFPVSEVGQ